MPAAETTAARACVHDDWRAESWDFDGYELQSLADLVVGIHVRSQRTPMSLDSRHAGMSQCGGQRLRNPHLAVQPGYTELLQERRTKLSIRSVLWLDRVPFLGKTSISSARRLSALAVAIASFAFLAAPAADAAVGGPSAPSVVNPNTTATTTLNLAGGDQLRAGAYHCGTYVTSCSFSNYAEVLGYSPALANWVTNVTRIDAHGADISSISI